MRRAPGSDAADDPAALSAGLSATPPPEALALQGPDESLDRLSRHLWLLQKRRGHRATSDDVLLAAAGLAALPAPSEAPALRLLDLGTGKGTVALLLLGARPDLEAVGVEAEPSSFDLAVRNARLNRLAGRYRPRLGDLRDPAVLADAGRFELVCGAPPFMPLNSGVLPQDPVRAAGRFELRGGVFDYARTAAAHLAPGGRVVLLMDGHGRARLEAAFAEAGLALATLQAVGPRPEAPPTFWIGTGGALGASGPATVDVTRLDLRGALDAVDPGAVDSSAVDPSAVDPSAVDHSDNAPTNLAWTPAYAALRASLRLP